MPIGQKIASLPARVGVARVGAVRLGVIPATVEGELPRHKTVELPTTAPTVVLRP